MRVRLLVPALLLASAALAPARPAAADDGAQIRRNYTAPIAGTPLPMWQWPEEKAPPKKAKSPALVILGGIFGGLGAAGAVTGLVLMATDNAGCPVERDTSGNVITQKVKNTNYNPPRTFDVPVSYCPGPTSRRDVGLTTLLASAGVAALGLTLVLVGVQPADEEPAAAARLVPTVSVGPTGGTLTWHF